MMQDGFGSDRFRNRLLALIAFVLAVAALRASYAVTMPLLFAAVIVAALWPLKLWLDRWLPSWLSYVLTIVALVAVLAGFAAAVYVSLGQVVAVLARNGRPFSNSTTVWRIGLVSGASR